ncbi:MAG TPA: hypothetical protein VD815_08400 [Candidatus Saccharimonadales bacterium]|nr:hypothetical protein [Candidatus Saccharimonadales bacterium]
MYKTNLFVILGIIAATSTLVGGAMTAPVFAVFHEQITEGISNMTGGMGTENTSGGMNNTSGGMNNTSGGMNGSTGMMDNSTMQ